jgi:hypothetical protein
MTTRAIIEEETATAGIKRQRVLSLVDRLHKEGRITFAMFSAATILRNLVMAVAPPTVGVSSYGDDAGRGDAPHGKADRVGRRLTGYEIDFDGHWSWVGGRKPLSDERKVEDAVFSAVGVYNDAGERDINRVKAKILVRACVDTEQMPTLAGITQELTHLYRGGTKGANGYALGHISEWLERLARHFRLVK